MLKLPKSQRRDPASADIAELTARTELTDIQRRPSIHSPAANCRLDLKLKLPLISSKPSLLLLQRIRGRQTRANYVRVEVWLLNQRDKNSEVGIISCCRDSIKKGPVPKFPSQQRVMESGLKSCSGGTFNIKTPRFISVP
ncbi:hypothetical protein Q8A67_021920 [Cirrhinus molitorella]|uniref:Uncharacterized protein n=1 Tax=Cirrhinus molitorella TaxID=172907 RepID=A0AA88TGH3_9TELE|nr:hypothetical protein Q8A67_021920 [Cirrhinus molitorella]